MPSAEIMINLLVKKGTSQQQMEQLQKGAEKTQKEFNSFFGSKSWTQFANLGKNMILVSAIISKVVDVINKMLDPLKKFYAGLFQNMPSVDIFFTSLELLLLVLALIVESVVGPAIIWLALKIIDLALWINDLPGPIKVLIGAFLAAGAIILMIIVVIITLIIIFAPLIIALVLLGVSIGTVGAVLGTAAVIIVLVIAIITLFIALMYMLIEVFDFTALEVLVFLATLMLLGPLGAFLVALFIEEMGGLINGLQTIGNYIKDFFVYIGIVIKNFIVEIIDAIIGVFTDAFDTISDMIDAAGDVATAIGVELDVPDLPEVGDIFDIGGNFNFMASGGGVQGLSRFGNTILGDNPSGREAIVPFERLDEFLDMANRGNSGDINIQVVVGERELRDIIIDIMDEQKSRYL